MSLTARPYQARALPVIQQALKKKQKVLVVAPCAAGKTALAALVTKWMLKYDKTTLMLLDREVLTAQNALRFEEYLGVKPGIACASLKRKNMSWPLTIGSRQTVAPMMRNGHADYKCDLVIPDEAHLIGKRGQHAEIFKKLVENNEKTRFLGLTATPYRLKSGLIYGPGKLFDCIDYKITAKELLEPDEDGRTWIVPLRWKIRKSDILKQLDQVEKMGTGELNEKQQGEVLSQPTFIDGIYDIWRQYFDPMKTCIFAINISHAEVIAAVFRSAGVRTWIVHSKLKIHDVRTSIREFSMGSGVMINVGILTIGSDIPSMMGIILAKRTMSTAHHYQIIGRLQRLFPGKEFGLVADLCGNRDIHGDDVDNPISISMDDGEIKEQPRKICPICETSTGLQTRVCPDCGFLYPVIKPEDRPPLEIKDHGPVGELVDAVPFAVVTCPTIKYRIHKLNRREIICAFYYNEAGAFVSKQYLFPGYGFGRSNSDKTRFYWFNLGGTGSVPMTAVEWIARAGELARNVKCTLDESGKFSVVKKVEKA